MTTTTGPAPAAVAPTPTDRAPHVGDPALASNLTRRVDFALFMVEAIDDDELVREAPAIVGRLSPSAQAYAGEEHVA